MKPKIRLKNKENSKPLVFFFILSFALAWLLGGVAIAVNYGLLDMSIPLTPFLLIGSWAPNIAAFIVLGVIMKKKDGIINLLKGWTKWKVNAAWYMVAFSPVVIAVLSIVLYGLFNGNYPVGEGITDPVLLIGALLIGLITGATGEELGWRGFALPRLQTRMNALFASLIMGVIWSVWHLPLWFAGLGFETMSFGAFTIVGVSFSVVITWALNNAKGSLVIASLGHLFLNFSLILFKDEVFPYFAGVFAVYALIIVIIYGPQKLSKKAAIPVD